MNESTPLNPLLYRRLLSRFGEVKIRNEGQARAVHVRRGLEDELKTKQWGEQYYVACPFCNAGDLAVSYQYAQFDASHRPMLHLAKCFGNDCLSNYHNRNALADMLKARDEWLTEARVLSGKVLSEEERIPSLPTPLTRLDQLKKGHPARRWLKEQGFDADLLARLYGLSFCQECDNHIATDRIIIPITMKGKHQGWQALSITSIPKHKYLSAPGMKTGELIYNMDKASEYPTPVLVLEPLDVWAFGRMALCPLGNSVSDRQISILKRVLRNKVAVLLHRRQDQYHSTVSRLRCRLDGPLLIVSYGNDIPQGRAGRSALRKLIAQVAEKRGMEVGYTKID